jgi:hypothetical protein
VPLATGAELDVRRKRSPWGASRDVERVIVGSHGARADVLLSGEGIHPEHVRLYLPADPAPPIDLLAIREASTRVNGRAVEPRDWTQLAGGEEIELGPWRFRYEAS